MSQKVKWIFRGGIRIYEGTCIFILRYVIDKAREDGAGNSGGAAFEMDRLNVCL